MLTVFSWKIIIKFSTENMKLHPGTERVVLSVENLFDNVLYTSIVALLLCTT